MDFRILATVETFFYRRERVLGSSGLINYPVRRLLEGSFRGGEAAGAEAGCSHVALKVQAMKLYIHSLMPLCLINLAQYTRVYSFHIDLIAGFKIFK